MSNPPLISGHVPSIAAANSAKVTGVPITTPPETPQSSSSAAVGIKRDSESELDEEPTEAKADSADPRERRPRFGAEHRRVQGLDGHGSLIFCLYGQSD